MVLVEATQVLVDGALWLSTETLLNNTSEASEETTNNQMELQAAIEGLKILKEPCQCKFNNGF